MNKIISLFTILLLCSTTKQFDLETCRSPLGIETGKILDSAFSSSSHARQNTIASKARIRSETDGWCPLNKISSTTYEYLQIDLVNLTVITLVELQGKFSFKSNDEFADAFRIEYRRDKEQKWIRYKDFAGEYVLSGNSNSYIPTIRDILPAIIAREIRIIPIVKGPIPRYVCMRLELYGCSYEDGLMAYSIPQGDKRGYHAQFFDETYDGENDNGTLKNGLGQLTDGIYAHDDYHLADTIQGKDQTGCDWIGWKRKSPVTSNIKLAFYFDTIRNFTAIRLHTSNLFIYDIYLFHSITITTCKKINNHRLYFIISNDYINTSARFIHVSFADEQEFISDCLHVTLTFNSRSKWILISEVQFDSKPIAMSSSAFPIKINNSKPALIDDRISLVRYWHWFFFALSLFILLIVSFLFVYINWMQTYQQHRKLYKSFNTKNQLKFSSNYRSLPHIDWCMTNNKHTASCISTISNHDICHQLIVSTPDSSRSMQSSDSNPTTMSTIYQSNTDSYLPAVSNDTTTLVCL